MAEALNITLEQLAGMTVEQKRNLARALEERERRAAEGGYEPDGKISYEDATKGEVAGELARSVGRGGQYAAEFFGDISDIVTAPFFSGEGRTVLNEMNPFSPPSSADKARENFYNTDAVRALTEERIERGGSGGLDAAKTALEYVLPTLTGGPSGGLKRAAASKLLGNGTKGAVRRALPRAAAEVAAVSGGAAGGEALGNAGTWEQGGAGEVIGAVAGGIFGPGGIIKAARKVDDMLGKATRFELDPADIEEITRIIMTVSDDPQLATQNFMAALNKGEIGTLADMTKDRAVYNFEALAKPGTKEAATLATRTAERGAQIQDRVSGQFGTGSIDDAINEATGRIGAARGGMVANQGRAVQSADAIEAQIKAAAQAEETTGLTRSRNILDQAETAAAQQEGTAARLSQAVALDTPVGAQSSRLAGAYELAEETLEIPKSAAWKVFEDHPPIRITGLDSMVNDMIEGLHKPDARRVRAIFGEELGDLKELGYNAKPDDVHAIIKTIKGKLKNTMQYDAPQAATLGIIKAMDNFLDASPAGTAYKAARKATTTLRERVNPGAVGTARRKAEGGMELFDRLNTTGPKGGLTADRVLASQDQYVIESFKDSIRAVANRDGVNAAFFKRYEEALNRFPELRQEFVSAIGAADVAGGLRKAAAATSKEQATVQKGLTRAREATETAAARDFDQAASAADANLAGGRQRLNKSMLGRFDDNPQKTVQEVLRKTHPTELEGEFRSLISAAGRTDEGKAGLKRLIGDEFVGSLKSTKGMVDPEAVGQFGAVRQQLLDAGIMSADEVSAIDEILGATDSVAMRKGARSVNEATQSLSEKGNLMASFIASMALRVAPGSSLILAGAVRRAVRDLMLKSPSPALVRGLNAMIESPWLFEKSFNNFQKPDTAKGIISMITHAGAVAADTVTGPFAPAAIVATGDREYRE